MFGPAIVSLTGKLDGPRSKLQLVHFRGFAPLVPLDGQITLDFDKNTAEGSWSTDIGTTGTCKVRVTSMSIAQWWARLGAINFRFCWRKYSDQVYVALLLFVVILDLVRFVQVSYPILILLLMPAPYILRNYLAQLIAMIQAARIKKIGPIEFEQNPMTQNVRQLITQEVQETVAFLTLDGFFAPRTKLILVWVAQNQAVDRLQFDMYATATLGVSPDNIDVTLNALIVSRCVTLEDARLTITEMGRRYVAHLIGQARPGSTA